MAVLLQNSYVFPAFSDRNTSGQPGARPPIDGKSFKKLEKLGKNSHFFDFYLKKAGKTGKTQLFRSFLSKKAGKAGENNGFGSFITK